jgi:hypothetical protein
MVSAIDVLFGISVFYHERVPEGRNDWKPPPDRSMPLGYLATLVALQCIFRYRSGARCLFSAG